ncbi:uncharacterized protein BDZ99DRAFT_469866 [Mytilinidion resinicola]|uniref:Uncharacterized protein n=1 Tax=Mytilinidion resinicola TaxID=574789 RepID=A0A6A6Z6P8_9PEZI|nr:uncharacterized protein BDZ99DRAFT_469866 [Mytilinidion resinicola]KAF2816766.1 hypothetical protein BDZ99DRAFT_469866 [Mytilinidion resinicola]
MPKEKEETSILAQEKLGRNFIEETVTSYELEYQIQLVETRRIEQQVEQELRRQEDNRRYQKAELEKKRGLMEARIGERASTLGITCRGDPVRRNPIERINHIETNSRGERIVSGNTSRVAINGEVANAGRWSSYEDAIRPLGKRATRALTYWNASGGRGPGTGI